jgi:hypothetical protein
MSQKVSIHVGGSQFNLELEDAFATYMQKELATTFLPYNDTPVKDLLHAYIKKSHELFITQSKLEQSIKKMERH